MKLKRKAPCKECPFRRSAPPGWLGPWNEKSIIEQAHSESGLSCHLSVKDLGARLPDAFESTDSLQAVVYKEVHVCVGSLQSANASCKSYRDPELSRMAKSVGKNALVMDAFEFMRHHQTPGSSWTGLRKKEDS